MPLSAHFTVDTVENPGEHIVAFGATVELALVSIVGADVITWEVLCASEPGYPLPTITPTGTPLGSTATFTFGSDPADDIGRSYRVRCTVSNVLASDSEDALIGAVNINGIVPLCPGEELERSNTHGWGPVINRLLAAGGSGPTSLGGDVTGATSSNTVVKIRGASVTVAGAVGTVLQVTGTNALGYALVALTSLAQSGASTGQVPVWNGSAWAAGGVTATSVTPGTARQIYFSNATPVAEWLTASGDVSVPVTAGVFRVDKINGASVPAAGGLNTGDVLQATGLATLGYAKVSVSSIAPGAAIAGQALIYNGSAWAAGNDFFARNLITTGTLGAGATTVTGLTISALSTGVLHSGVAGAVTSSLIVNADVATNAGIVLSKLGQSGAATGQAAVWNGSAWAPGTPSGVGTGSITPGVPTQILATIAGPSSAWVTVSGDISVPVTAGTFRVDKINGTAVTTAGGGSVGAVLRMTAPATSDFGQLDLANAAAITGLLPLANIAGGGATAGQVLTWNGTVWAPAATGIPSTMQLVADMPALEALPVTALSDRILCIVQTPPRIYWLDKGATPAASGDDELPPANGGGAWRFKEAA